MKNKEKIPFRRRLVKFYFSIKGWWRTRKMVVGEYYVSKHIPNSRFMWRGNRTFYQAFAASPCPGVMYTDQRKKVYPYWQIGIFDFKKG